MASCEETPIFRYHPQISVSYLLRAAHGIARRSDIYRLLAQKKQETGAH
jgi:hypothetical protein